MSPDNEHLAFYEILESASSATSRAVSHTLLETQPTVRQLPILEDNSPTRISTKTTGALNGTLPQLTNLVKCQVCTHSMMVETIVRFFLQDAVWTPRPIDTPPQRTLRRQSFEKSFARHCNIAWPLSTRDYFCITISTASSCVSP